MNEDIKRHLGKDFEKIQNLSHDAKAQILRQMPKKGKAWIFVKFCDNHQLDDLIDEWVTLGKEEDLKALKRQLRKQRRGYYNPKL